MRSKISSSDKNVIFASIFVPKGQEVLNWINSNPQKKKKIRAEKKKFRMPTDHMRELLKELFIYKFIFINFLLTHLISFREVIRVQ